VVVVVTGTVVVVVAVGAAIVVDVVVVLTGRVVVVLEVVGIDMVEVATVVVGLAVLVDAFEQELENTVITRTRIMNAMHNRLITNLPIHPLFNAIHKLHFNGSSM